MKLIHGIKERGLGRTSHQICTEDGNAMPLTKDNVEEVVRRNNTFEGGDRDGCQLCYGANGGVPGNENRIYNLVVCDYCTVKLTDIRERIRLLSNIALSAVAMKLNIELGVAPPPLHALNRDLAAFEKQFGGINDIRPAFTTVPEGE